MTETENMNRSAVLHIPMSQYAFAAEEDVFVIRLRTAKGDLDECALFYGDRACTVSPVQFTKIGMERRYQDELFDFYEAAIAPCPARICYYFELRKGKESIYCYADAFYEELPDLVMADGFVVEGRSEYYQYPYILRSEVQRLPEWFQEAVVYNIFPDSFADGAGSLSCQSREVKGADGRVSKSRLGGTIRGILDNLDYIRSLGFNCLYLNPIFRAGEYHKYDILDYFHVDPCMGSDEDFRLLVESVHARGMHIIIDGVFNHCSWYFPQFEDVVKKGKGSFYCDWFYELEFPVRRPDTEKETPGYACFAYERKMPKLNTANIHVQDYFARVGRYWVEEFQVDGFAWGMTDMFLRYPEQISRGQLNLLDSHDVPRFFSLCGEDYERWQAAFLYLCMAPGVPSVFYGDECKISGIRENDYRKAMPWGEEHTETEQFVRAVIGIRQKWIEPSAAWRVTVADAAENLLVFERAGKNRVRVMIHQGGDKVDVTSYLAGGEILLQERVEGSRLGRNGFAVCLFE